jgi:hypothetical protein
MSNIRRSWFFRRTPRALAFRAASALPPGLQMGLRKTASRIVSGRDAE